MIIGAMVWTFTYFRFTDSIWAAGITGLIVLAGIYFNDYKGRKSKRGGDI
jgi:hypothetical protein